MFLEYHSTDNLKVKRLESQILFKNNKTKGSKQDCHNRIRAPMSEEVEP